MTAGTVNQWGADENWTTVCGRRGVRCARRKRKRRDGKSTENRGGTMIGKGRELVDMMQRKKADIRCALDTKWKGSKVRSFGSGFELFYQSVYRKRNGERVLLKEDLLG